MRRVLLILRFAIFFPVGSLFFVLLCGGLAGGVVFAALMIPYALGGAILLPLLGYYGDFPALVHTLTLYLSPIGIVYGIAVMVKAWAREVARLRAELATLSHTP